MTEAKQGDTVKVHYTGKLDDGTVFDTSEEREPLEFQVGAGQVIPGFEQEIVGMNPGETKTTRVSADEAYGPHREDMVLAVERSEFPDHIQPEVGKQLQLPQPDGQTVVATITEVSDSKVTLDANHPLAGKDLTFDLELVEVS